VLVPPDQQRTAFALDSVGGELTFMLAPTIGVLLATQVSTAAALTVIGVATVGAGLLLMWFNPPTTSRGTPTPLDAVAPAAAAPHASGPRDARDARDAPDAADAPVARGAIGYLLAPAVLVVLAAGVAAALVLNGTDVAIIAALNDAGHAGSVGWVIALWCAGSVVGGLVYGAGRRDLHPLVLVALLSACTLPAALATTPAQLAVAVVLAGVPCAAALSAINAALVAAVPEARRGEVMGWSGTAATVGAAIGAPLVGLVVDHRGAQIGFLAAGGAGLALALGGLLVLRVVRARIPAPPVALAVTPRRPPG